MEWILLASLIIGLVETLNSSLTTKERLKAVSKEFAPVIKQMNKDSQLMNELEQAYQRKDSGLIQSLLNASPFASDVNSMRNELRMNKSRMKKLADDRVKVANEQAAINNKYQDVQNKASSSGSVIGDLITGGSFNESNQADYKGSGYTDKDLQEVSKTW